MCQQCCNYICVYCYSINKYVYKNHKCPFCKFVIRDEDVFSLSLFNKFCAFYNYINYKVNNRDIYPEKYDLESNFFIIDNFYPCKFLVKTRKCECSNCIRNKYIYPRFFHPLLIGPYSVYEENPYKIIKEHDSLKIVFKKENICKKLKKDRYILFLFAILCMTLITFLFNMLNIFYKHKESYFITSIVYLFVSISLLNCKKNELSTLISVQTPENILWEMGYIKNSPVISIIKKIIMFICFISSINFLIIIFTIE